MKLILFAMIALTSANLYGQEIPDCSKEAPWEFVETKETKKGLFTVKLYSLQRDVGVDIWQQQFTCLNIVGRNGSLWVAAPKNSSFILGDIIGPDSMLIMTSTASSSKTELFSLESSARIVLGKGSGSYVSAGKNEKFVSLGQKRYIYNEQHQGAYWFSKLVNLKGELVEFTSDAKSGPCIKISEIVFENESIEKLRQSLDECIIVHT